MRLRIPTITLLLLLATISVWSSLPKSADRDQDGVADKFDKCKETPTGTKVDKSGCTIVEKKKADVRVVVEERVVNMDRDGDGLTDKFDQCPDEEGPPSNDGCPKKEPKVPEGMVAIPAGCFNMGSNDGALNEKPVHKVCLSSFNMDKYEVTQEEYERMMGSNPSVYTKCASCPVHNVSWNKASEYCARKGRTLPTEAQWEYVATVGGRNLWRNNSERDYETLPVGQKQPNDWGMFDMDGNVWEWISDNYEVDYYNFGVMQDPQGVANSSSKWKMYRGSETFSSRNISDNERPYSSIGFRCVSGGPDNLPKTDLNTFSKKEIASFMIAILKKELQNNFQEIAMEQDGCLIRFQSQSEYSDKKVDYKCDFSSEHIDWNNGSHGVRLHLWGCSFENRKNATLRIGSASLESLSQILKSKCRTN